MTDKNEKNLFEFNKKRENPENEIISIKGYGYFRHALIDFARNRASLVAAFIIIAIVLFAVFVPFFNTSGTGTVPVSRYMRLGPRSAVLSKLGILDGEVKEDYSEISLISTASLGMPDSGDISVGGAIDEGGELQAVKKIISSREVKRGSADALLYRASVDEYLKIGYVYMYLDRDELLDLEKKEGECGIKIFYPMVEENEYNYALAAGLYENANFWYKTDTRGYPLDADGERQDLSNLHDVYLVDNYKRDIDGNLVYYLPSGEQMYKVRVLFYNYYKATHGGREPSFLFGTDSAGYDLAYRTAIGIRLSLLLSLSVFLINFIIGAVWGAVGGYFGGKCDLILQFISYVLAGVPFMVVATLFGIYLAHVRARS